RRDDRAPCRLSCVRAGFPRGGAPRRRADDRFLRAEAGRPRHADRGRAGDRLDADHRQLGAGLCARGRGRVHRLGLGAAPRTAHRRDHRVDQCGQPAADAATGDAPSARHGLRSPRQSRGRSAACQRHLRHRPPGM
ncbi:hypothetical protein LTR94_033396, partial [Friedmanniomyces endolithicus]